MDNAQLERAIKLLESAQSNIEAARSILGEKEEIPITVPVQVESVKSEVEVPVEPEATAPAIVSTSDENEYVEGVFDGQTMIDAEGKKYPVLANYASKSKLVAGDILKLTIQPDGRFLYKQIGPVERKTLIGILKQEGNHFHVLANDKKFNVLLASVTYFKAELGDEVTIIIPANEESDWACIENVLAK